jgi:hypothetical protein
MLGDYLFCYLPLRVLFLTLFYAANNFNQKLDETNKGGKIGKRDTDRDQR